MCKLAIQQTDYVAPRGKRTTLFVYFVFLGQRADHSYWDELAKLIENDTTVLGWFWLFFHSGFLGRKPPKANLFFSFYTSLWDGCDSFSRLVEDWKIALGKKHRRKYSNNDLRDMTVGTLFKKMQILHLVGFATGIVSLLFLAFEWGMHVAGK